MLFILTLPRAMNNNISDYLVFYPKSREALAKSLQKHNPEKQMTLYELDQKLFPDGEPEFTLPSLHECFNRDVLYIADWTTCEHRYYDILCLAPIAELGPRTLTILLPFLGSGTMERESADGNIATANVEAKLLSWIPGAGIKRVITVDLHTLQNQFYYNNTSVTMESAMPHVIKRLGLHPFIIQTSYPDVVTAPSRFMVCFPDNGAKSRFAKYFEGLETAICGTVRKGDEGRAITLEEGNVSGKDMLSVDDLVRTGGTLLTAAEILIARGAKNVSVFVTHAVFPGQSWRKFIDSPLIERFFTTNSVYSVAKEIQAADPQQRKFEIIDLGQCLSNVL